MTLEQNLTKFNIENFKENFKSTLEKYASVVDNLEHICNDEELEKEKKELELEEVKYMNQLVSISINALSLVDNKQEVLNTTYSIFLDMGIDRDIYFQNIILELLKTQK